MSFRGLRADSSLAQVAQNPQYHFALRVGQLWWQVKASRLSFYVQCDHEYKWH
jgi:hypothetical protein